jgi:hypothetical protein
MKRFLLLLILAGIVSAQDMVTISVKLGTAEKFWNILRLKKVALADFRCAVTESEPGDVACTVTLTAPARSAVTVIVTLPAGLATGPPSVLIPAGSVTATFTITILDVYAGNPETFNVAYTWRLGACTQPYASVLLACCARADRCGLRDNEIAWGPCGG